MADTRTDEQKAKDVSDTLGYLAKVRIDFEAQIDNIIEFVNHSRRKITDKDAQKGQKTGLQVFDGTAIAAANICTDGMVGNLCSRNQRWFRFSLPGKLNFPKWSGMRAWSGKRMDEYPDVRLWLQNCEEVQYSALTRSNFYDVVSEFVRDGVTIGTSHLLSEENLKAGRIMFVVPHFRECFIAEDQFGRVDTNYRVYRMTLRQLADKFTQERMEAVDPTFRQSYDDNPHAEREIIHAIYPRKDQDPGREDGRAKPIASLWVLREPLKLIDEGGYNWMPSTTWRWRKNNDEWYGRSPAWDAYVEIMKANQQGRSNLIAGHKMVEPPMVGTSDQRGKVNNAPGAWTWIDANADIAAKAPRPLMTGIQLPYGIDSQERTQRVIEQHFAVPFFMALTSAAADKVELTATQVVEMMGEKAVILVTRVGMLEAEGLNPIHDRVFEIEARAGRMPEPPEILREYAGGPVEIQYLGPLAQAQMRLSKVRSIQSGVSLVAQMAQVSPAAAMMVETKVNWMKTVDAVFEATGFPEDCLNSDDEANKLLAARAEEQKKQQQIDALPNIAKAVRAGVSAPEQGSPMQKIMNPEAEQQVGAA